LILLQKVHQLHSPANYAQSWIWKEKEMNGNKKDRDKKRKGKCKNDKNDFVFRILS